MVLVFVEGAGDELSQQALAFARGLGEELHAVLLGPGAEAQAAGLGAHGVALAHLASDPRLDAYAPAAYGQAVAALTRELGPAAVIAPGSERGNEVLAHAAARLEQPLSANTVTLALGHPAAVTRVRWGGSLLEEAHLHGTPLLATVAPHAVAAERVGAQEAEVRRFDPQLSESDLVVRVSERVGAGGGGVSLADAEVVVSGGRGVGSAEGFGVIEELAELIGAAVGCSRAVTMAGWRPHTDQVGQTGTKIAPELYIACGISGATQHMAGCKGAKRLLAINPDAEASIFASADYAVIGDLHEVVPAISAEIRRAKGG
ncbi:MAG TPA: electron transfer flavoprotein subunit alpha/FixB family protein [Solirubrobacteraceae bacterium]|nr:electron transfer flavoprotein subunit alpha/FixB family protein [Solirubrobacteraceae bacterium]